MDPLNLILLIIVVLIGLRLRSVLGTRNDDEQPGSRADAYRLNRDAFENSDNAPARPVAAEPPTEAPRELKDELQDAPQEPAMQAALEAETEEAGPFEGGAETGGRGLAYLMDIEPDFDEAGFLDGAARAYEMTLTAFADGDLAPVRGFLADDVAAGFEAAIAERQAAGQQLVTQILRLDRPAVDDAVVDETMVQLDVRFRAELISFTCAADAVPDEDNRPAPATAHDVWRFARPLHADGPGWTLVATHAG